MRSFGTRGRVYPDKHYIVSRTEEIRDFINRIKDGRYIVLFAPRQTGKTTFFRFAAEALTNEDTAYFPIQLNFEEYKNLDVTSFYSSFHRELCRELERGIQRRAEVPSVALEQLLTETKMTDHISMRYFFENLSNFLNLHYKIDPKVALIIDEFDGIPQSVVSDFLHSLRHVYLSDELQCPHSVSIVGVKSITQLNYDRSVSPFNIQNEFNLQNFSLQQVDELLSQWTDEVGQAFDS